MSTSIEGKGNYPLVYATEPFIRCAVAYNPFDLTDIAKFDLVYDQDKTLADYMDGLPQEAGWTVALEGTVIDPEAWSATKPAAFSHIVVVRAPHGGRGGGKTVLRIVALIALAAFAPMLAANLLPGSIMGITVGAAITNGVAAAITVAGGMLINALLPPTAGLKSSAQESKSYGIDGPKNTAQEGGVVSIGYGQYRLAGNIVDMFTRNVGEDQYLFMRTVLNQGEIESIEDLEINGEPISSFSNVQVRKRFGTNPEQPNDWFDESTRLINQSIHLSPDWVQRVTTSEVDRLRIDVAFPGGLYSIDQDNGVKKDTRQVTLEFQYAPCDAGGTLTGDWQNFPIVAQRPVEASLSAGASQQTVTGSTSATLNVQTTGSILAQTYSVEGFYRAVGTTTWISAGTVTGRATPTGTKIANVIDANSFPVIQYTFQFPTAGQYEMKVTGGTVTGDDAGYSVSSESIQTSLLIKNKTSKALRFTYEGAILPRGYYAVRMRRTDQEKLAHGQQVDYVYDECYITDIGEIDITPVNLNGLANLSICIKASEQITSVPSLTAKCKISKVNVYDEEGNVLGFQWSDNPADVVADMLFNPIRGAGYPTSKMVWPKYVEFREHCEAEGLKFNGVYDTAGTLWDAMQKAARVGHGTIVPRGTKFSLAIDKAADPVALFTPANMLQDTFKKTWLSMTDRANEIQLRFADAENGYKEATVRLADNAAFARGAKQKIATTDGFGITLLDQAKNEAEYAARQNSYVRSFVEFEAPLEAIGLTIGDVALIQHNSVDFNGGVGGRFAHGSTESAIELDRPVTMVNGKTYSLLAFHSALKRFDVVITNILGGRLTVSGLPSVDPTDLPRILRLKQGARDVEVIDVRKSGSNWVVVVDDNTGLANGTAQLWDLDVIEERTVVTASGDHSTVTVTAPFSLPPEEFANFLFGEKLSVKLPFRLRSINGNGLDTRTLSFVQYDDRCYQQGGWDVPAITRPGGSSVGQVRNLMADYTRNPLPSQERIPVTLSWTPPLNTIYGGADIHIFEDDRWHLLGSVNDVLEYRADFSRGEIVKFKVVAFDQNRARARFADAPIVLASLDVFEINLNPPTNLQSEIYWRTDATIRLKWDAPSDADGYYQYRVEHKPLGQTDFDAFMAVTDPANYAPVITDDADYLTEPLARTSQADIDKIDLGRYVTRVRAEKGFNASPWVYLGVNVEAADIAIAITGLKLTGGTHGAGAIDDTFQGPDANWTWDDILAQAPSVTDPKTNLPLMLQDYQVRIYDPDGVLIRTEYTNSPNYTYSYSKNNEDTPDVGRVKARRQFRISVRIRGRQGQLGLPASMNVTNPPPARPTGIVAFADAQAMFVRWDICKEVDYAGTVVWMSDQHGFTPDDSTRAYSGNSDGARIPCEPAKQFYVRVGHFDTFDGEPVNITQEYGAFIPTLVVDQLQEAVDAGIEVSTKISGMRDAIDNIAKSTLQLGLQSVADRKYTDLLARVNHERLNTVVIQEINDRSDADNAILDVISLIGAVSPDGMAFEANGSTFKVGVDDDGNPISLSQKFQAIVAQMGDNLAQLRTEIEAATGPDSSIASQLNTLAARIDVNAAAITNEASVRATAVSAEASARNALAVSLGNTISAAISNEASLRVDGDGALATTLSLIGVKSADGASFKVDQTKFLLDGSQTTASVLSGINSRFGTVEASVSTEATARATAVQSVASQVTTIQSSLNGLTSSVTSQATAINGLSARYGLAVTAGGYITGFVANADQTGGSFVILANNFALVDSAFGNYRVPFQYSGGILRAPSIEIDTIKAGTIVANHVSANNIAETSKGTDNSNIQITGGTPVLISWGMTTSGGWIDIEAYIQVAGTGGSIAHHFDVYHAQSGANLGRFGTYSFGGQPHNVAISPRIRHRPGAGYNSYYIVGSQDSGGGTYYKNIAQITITDNKTQS